jgi:hypothetical protein
MNEEIKCPVCGTVLIPEDTDYRCTECDEIWTLDALWEKGIL